MIPPAAAGSTAGYSCISSGPQQPGRAMLSVNYVVSDHHHQQQQQQQQDVNDVSSNNNANNSSNLGMSFLYSLSVLKDKVHQVQSLATLFVPPEDHHHHHHHHSSSQHDQSPQSTAMAIASMGTLIQEIIVTASSLMFTCQHISLGAGSSSINNNDNGTPSSSNNQLHHQHQHHHDSVVGGGGNRVVSQLGDQERGQGFYSMNDDAIDSWYNTNDNMNNSDHNELLASQKGHHDGNKNEEDGLMMGKLSPPKSYDIVELDAADLLAKYTHYCQVCGKGFKRDANLRMHMRAHGDEYKSSAALSNPHKKNNNSGGNGKDDLGFTKLPRKYSCPQEGCRWNKKHAKFQPLKSMICVKNHYKRSHCPKMYVCKRCNRKQFSVLSDLRTHEKHCGDLKWQCSCGTTFSRKDKLSGHVALFTGHTPAISSLEKMGIVDQNPAQMQLDIDR